MGELPEPVSAILVVEDEAPIRTLWERFLERWGFRAELAENGQIALQKGREADFPLVITDLTMPVMTGQELIYKLKKEKPDTEFIVTTGDGTIEIAVEMMKAGAFDFLTKPINFGHAEMVIKKCLQTIQARKENARLRQENRDLEELNEIKEKFIAITSHELRTPVSIINHIVEILAPEMDGPTTGKLFPLIARSSRQLKEIVGAMHELSRSNSAKLELQIASFDLNPLCEEIHEELGLVLEKRNHSLAWKIPANFAMRADRLKFKKVVRELVQNAIKYTEDGGSITVAATKVEPNDIELVVADTGIGIPTEAVERIFDLFYEVSSPLHHHTSKDDFLGGGIGVGLSIVKDIVEAHQGSVRVESSLQQGSNFVVRLPGAGAAAERG